MPVTSTSDSVDCSAKSGAGAWIGRYSVAVDRALLVHGLADDVQDAAERDVADRHLDRLAGVGDLEAADEAFGGVHGDGAHGALAEVLGDLEHEPLAVVVGLERVEDLGQVVLELDVDDGADDLGNLADCCLGHCRCPPRALPRPK